MDYPSPYFFDRLSAVQKEILDEMHHWLLLTPQVRMEMKWRVPFYSRHRGICYLNPVGIETMEWCFIRARDFEVEIPELQSRGRKMVAGLLLDQESIHEEELRMLIWDIALETDAGLASAK